MKLRTADSLEDNKLAGLISDNMKAKHAMPREQYIGLTDGNGSSTDHTLVAADTEIRLSGAAADRQMSAVLIADDEPFNQMALTGLLQQFNLTAEVAIDGVEAIKLVKERLRKGQPMYKLILMDYSMPRMDGPRCVKQIRELLTQLPASEKRPRICCVTAYNETTFKSTAIGVGMDEFVTKPIFKNQMYEQLLKSDLIQ